MGFPQLGNIDKRIVDTINSKAGKNLRASQIMPWIRVTSCLGDFLSLQSSKESESFAQRYGNTGRSGRLGTDKKGKSVYADEGDRGLRPSPTIDSISISQGNEGLSKKSSFTIICYSLGQCEKIMEFFLEPGNMVLVEWGENNNLSWGQKANIDTCAIAAYNSLKTVQTKRRNSKGMYDAVLGVITGGGMSYGGNETFEVQVELTSVGELPAYLQHHKGISTKKTENETSKKYKSFEIAAESDVGKRLFQQMYNDLPAIKRTATIKNKINDPFFTDSINFINMDKEIREDLIKSVKDANLMTEEGEIEITSEVPLFTEKRFIRVALAFSIIDLMDDVVLEPTPEGDCKGKNAAPSNGKVVWENTICRAHKNMFSADSNYLYIPNKYAPSFDLQGALTTDKEAFESPLPKLSGKELSADNCVDLHPRSYGGSKTSYFPCNKALNFEDQACYDGSYVPLKEEAGNWGYLRDLYINFDFFCDELEKSGLVTKDIYYDLLNGMSSAVNLYWNFQIIPRGSIEIHTPGGDLDADTYYRYQKAINSKKNDGVEELQVVDASMGGNIKMMGTSVGLAKFQSRGAKTPFLSAELNFDIPGAMKGQVIGSKLAKKNRASIQNPNAEDKEIRLDGLFSNKIDSVLDALNSVREAIKDEQDKKSDSQMTESERKAAEKKRDKDAKEAKEEQQKANYEYFVENGTVIPMEQDRDADRDMVNNWYEWGGGSDAVNLEDIAVVGAWNDGQVLKKVQLMNEGLLSGGTSTLGQRNVPLLPIKFNFTIHGVSGIRVGDTFNIIDLPSKYKTKVFQVTQVGHDIAQNIWTTKIEGSMRNMEAGTGELKEYS